METLEALFLPNILDGESKDSAFLNCIRKNYRHVRKWAKRTQTNCFRIYDRHMHHYPLAIDFYAGRFCIQYFCPQRDFPDPTEDFMEEVEKGLQKLFGADPALIFWRNRIK